MAGLERRGSRGHHVRDPFVFGDTSLGVAAAVAYVLGVLIVLAGLGNAATERLGGFELVPAVLTVILFVSPWIFGFTAVTALAAPPALQATDDLRL
ncbi:MAG: SPW repeat domain-containing protein [Candidatus Dormibacteraceae bacterium]